jgi:two-component system alkaline phosphatase synthesis response regulator PhoP
MPKLLVVDDDKDVIELVRFIAERDGYQALQAGDGKEGVDQALAEKPDLIIMDIMMPDVDGYTATIELCRREETKHIPIIVLTAKGNMRAQFELSPNVAAYIEKPFEPKQLSDVIRRHIQRPPA